MTPVKNHGLSVPETPAFEAVTTLSSAIPWLGGPVSNVLSGMTQRKKFERVAQVINGLRTDLIDIQTEASKEYVKTEAFEDLLEKTLRKVGEERRSAKRESYRRFLVDCVRHPEVSMDDQEEVLPLFELLSEDNVRVLGALGLVPQNPSNDPFGSPMQTLRERLKGMREDTISTSLHKLQRFGLVKQFEPMTMTSGPGAQNLVHFLTTLGRKFIAYCDTESGGWVQ